MNLSHYIKKALSMPPQELALKVVNKISTNIKDKLQKSKDFKYGTHLNFNVPLIENSYINIKELDTSNIKINVARYLSQMYREHRFDLLGSGWVKNSYDSIALGIESYKYNMNVQAPQSTIDGYESIDWQKDYKSGYRWNEKTWYKDQPFGHKLGVDIKVPWELARFQHLPQLAIFALVDEDLKEQNIKEFKHQVLDFIVNNPPRKGVNWVCTMDVGIRVANMLIAYDMLTQIDDFDIFDDDFKQIFSNSIYEHGLHIINNLEYNENERNNHYLSNIVGLLFVSAYLVNSELINEWLLFSIQETITEMDFQFYEDGGNFESSTSYHRLSGELMIYATTLILGLKEEKIKSLQNCNIEKFKINPRLQPIQRQLFIIENSKIKFPQWYVDRLYKIGRFTVDITKANGNIAQFGDNDSGRFFKLSPNGSFLSNIEATKKYLNLKDYKKNNELFWDESILNHTTFISCFSGFFNEEIFLNTIYLEKSMIKSIAKIGLEVKNKSYTTIKQEKSSYSNLKYQKEINHNLKLNIQQLQFAAYPRSGIFIYKTNNFHLAICATPIGQNNNGGHTHNDKLGYELYIENKNIILDPGTYLYTPLPHMRNMFRSVKAHAVPIVENIEQNSWSEGHIGLFRTFNESKCVVIDFDNSSIQLALQYNGTKIIRKFEIKADGLSIIDHCNKMFNYHEFYYYSDGYGKISKNA